MHLFRSLVVATVFGLAAVLPPAARATPELVMVERAGCAYCVRWNAEIGPIYPLTEESQRAPLRRIDLNDPVPDDLDFSRRVVFTPTFVLVEDGKEVARLEGYPGEDFFWGLLDRMLDELDK